MAHRRNLEQYLRNHFRYYTMNSWNQSTSYGWNVKLHNLKLDRETRMKAYEFLDVSEAYEEIRELLEDFARSHDHEWQANFNGRSDGYLVLYRGGRRDPGWKTRCNECAKLTWYKTEQPCHVEGCEGRLELLTEPVYETFVWPGKGVDEDADFSAWSLEELKDRVRVVRDFDRLAKACIRSFINFVKTHRVEEQEILVPKRVRVAVKTG